LFGASGVFGQLQDSLNTIWEVKAKPGAGIWGFIRARFLSLCMVLGTGFLLLVSLALTTFIDAVTGSMGGWLPMPAFVLHLLNFGVSFVVITLLFAMIFKYLPDVHVPFTNVWIGAVGTALLFTLGKYGLAMYLGRESTASPYGAAGSVIIILMWVYYASLILFFGAEFTQVYTKKTAPVALKPHAVPVRENDRAEQGIPRTGSKAGERASKPIPVSSGPSRPSSPGKVAHKQPWQFITLMLAAGFTGGIILKFKSLRTAVRVVSSLRKGSRVQG
jgi:membrane protein